MAVLNAQLLGILLWIQSQPQGITFIDLTRGDSHLTLASVILGTFRSIGIALLVAAAIGGTVGLFRIWVCRRFPDNGLNGVDVEPFTLLHLNEHSEADR